MIASIEQTSRAREMYRGDWDADGTSSVHLPHAVAVALLEARGWRWEGPRGTWVAPNGEHTEFYVADALQIALTAEVA